MDGGGRLLRSLSALVPDPAPLAHARLHLATAGGALAVVPPPRLRPRKLSRRNLGPRLAQFLVTHVRFVGLVLGSFFFVVVGAYGAVCGGEYAAFLENYGSISDFVAGALGFGIDTVTISGISELSEKQVLDLAGISPKRSLIFLDPAEVRRKLKAQPIVEDASVTKLYPDRLMIALTERQPFALWQKDGEVSVIGRDGIAIDTRHDGRYDSLPFIAGDGANRRIEDYVKLLAAAGDLKPKIRAGTLIADRRWDLVLNSGLLVKLPEINPAAAVTTLAALDRTDHILDKDIVFIDLRMPDRVVLRLTDEAAAARAAALSHKAGKRGGPT